MKLTKSKLKEIIKEELNEAFGQMTIGDLRYHLKKSSLDNPVWVEVRGNAYMIKGVRVDKKRNMTFIQVQ
jgi:RNase P/RNase MRP subunit POP5